MRLWGFLKFSLCTYMDSKDLLVCKQYENGHLSRLQSQKWCTICLSVWPHSFLIIKRGYLVQKCPTDKKFMCKYYSKDYLQISIERICFEPKNFATRHSYTSAIVADKFFHKHKFTCKKKKKDLKKKSLQRGIFCFCFDVIVIGSILLKHKTLPDSYYVCYL